ncbi:MAG: hypothetical protein FJ164_10135 [Gammaproteobacteria bacterium]|nr:hypothetical protein [Gammaproteobacteria bacterium]
MIERLRCADMFVRTLCLLGLCLTVAASWADTPQAPAESFSEAERLLWTGDQLKAIEAPMTLEYRFKKSGTLEAGFEDKVVFTIHKVRPDGLKSASLAFFTGERQFPIEPEEATDANPVLKVYLQGDVYEMNRLTDADGKARERWRYFQRRIKFALAEAAEIKPVSFEFQGRRHEGREILFAPYVKDPKRALFERFADKTYRVVVSETLPGYLHEVTTLVPGEGEGAPPLIAETLSLVSAKPL